MTIKEAQELVEAWNAKNNIPGSEPTPAVLISPQAEELSRTLSQSPATPLTDQIGDLFWNLLSLSSQSGTDLTEALINTLEKKNKPSTK